MRYFLTGFGFLCHVDLPFRLLNTSSPNIFSAIIMSIIVTGHFLMTLILSNNLEPFVADVPTMWYSFLASFACSNCTHITVPIRLLVLVSISDFFRSFFYILDTLY